MTWWLVISVLETFVLIPALVWRFGKGAFCGWICSCGALAETMGDQQRQKMPHGPRWNRLNMLGQAILGIAFCAAVRAHRRLAAAELVDEPTVPPAARRQNHQGHPGQSALVQVGGRHPARRHPRRRPVLPLLRPHVVPLCLSAGGADAHLCALFALPHLPEKKKCISCNVCTSVCHMGIDIMNFANKGLPIAGSRVRALLSLRAELPTGTLTFGMAERTATC